MALERELAVYNEHLMELLPSEGKYVVIKGEQILGVYDSLDDALGAGYDRFGDVDFLVKQIHAVEPIEYFSRDIR
jgi:hypothetical protein